MSTRKLLQVILSTFFAVFCGVALAVSLPPQGTGDPGGGSSNVTDGGTAGDVPVWDGSDSYDPVTLLRYVSGVLSVADDTAGLELSGSEISYVGFDAGDDDTIDTYIGEAGTAGSMFIGDGPDRVGDGDLNLATLTGGGAAATSLVLQDASGDESITFNDTVASIDLATTGNSLDVRVNGNGLLLPDGNYITLGSSVNDVKLSSDQTVVYVDAPSSGANTGDGTLDAGRFQVGDGSAGAPSLSFQNDIDTGFYNNAADGAFSVSCNGTNTVNFGTSNVVMLTTNLKLNDGRALVVGTGSDTFLTGDGATAGLLQVGTTSGGTDGTVAVGTRYGTDSDTQIVMTSANTINMTSNGSSVMQVVPNTVRVRDDVQLRFGSGDDVFQQGEVTTLTDNTATTVFSVNMADGETAGFQIAYKIESVDGSALQLKTGMVTVGLIDQSGVVSTGGGPVEHDTVTITPAGSLTVTWSIDSTDDGSIEIQANANSDQTTPTITCRWWIVACQGSGVDITVP